MAEIKITNASTITHAMELLKDNPNFTEDEMAKMEKILASFSRSSSSKSPKQMAKESANLALMDSIANYLSDGNPRTATEVFNNVEGVTSTSKASFLLSSLIKNGKVNRNVVKGTPYYSIA